MIKIIACDMDGTLLNDQKQLPENFWPTVAKLREKDIKFVVASGGEYYNLIKLMHHNPDDLIFICENGTIIFEGSNNIFCSAIEYDKLAAPVEAVRRTPGIYPILCGLNSAYVENDYAKFIDTASMFYERCQLVPDILEAAKKDKICKIAVFSETSSATCCLPVLKHFEQDFMVALSGQNWLDLMPKNINKGSAIRFLQKRYQTNADGCMAFGDYMNDYELMTNCSESYAMANAQDELKKVCKYLTLSNNENGVIHAIEQYLAQH